MDSCGVRAGCSGGTAEATTGWFTRRPSGGKTALYTSALAVLAATLLGLTACARRPERPSLLLVVYEGVRADHMSVYGFVRQTTPGAEVLAAEGAVFEKAYASSADGPAGIGSLLTGRYPPEHGLFLSRTLNPAAQTLAEVLADAGYATYAISSEPDVTRESGLLQGFQEVETVDPAESEEADGGAAQVTRRAVDWLNRGRDSGRPFFLMLIYSSPLLPFSPPGEYRYKFVDPSVVRQRVEIVAEYWVPFANRFNANETDISAHELNALTDLYDGEIAYVDGQGGAVVTALREKKILDGTLVVLTSDRGEDLGERHRLADSTSLRESSLRVPLVMRYPGKIPAGLKIGGLAQDVDVLPTVCDILGVPRPPTVTRQAVSHYPFDVPARRTNAVSVALRPGPERTLALTMSVRDAKYRFVLSPQGPAGLYDLGADALESVDLTAKSPEIAGALTQRLREWDESLQGLPGADQAPQGPAATPGAPPSAAAHAPQTAAPAEGAAPAGPRP